MMKKVQALHIGEEIADLADRLNIGLRSFRAAAPLLRKTNWGFTVRIQDDCREA